ncbi:MAG: divalent metal cation transporter, partial [Actinomycetota bacterium]|nr:divalent metal cation transporter [Actinomycetota bacterium]
GEHIADLDAICVIDDEGRLVDDVSMGELLLADPDAPVADLIEPPWPMTVTVEAPFSEVVNRLIDARRQSVAVVFAPGRLHRRRVRCVDPGAAFGTGLGVRPVVSDGIGAVMELLGVSRYLAVPIAAGVVWALVIFGSYRSAERVFLVLSLAFLVFPIAAVLPIRTGPRPDRRCCGPISWPKEFLLLGVALIGTTITPYMQFYVAAAVPTVASDSPTAPQTDRHRPRCSFREPDQHVHHHRHRRCAPHQVPPDLGRPDCPGPAASGLPVRRATVRAGAAWPRRSGWKAQYRADSATPRYS